MATEIFGVKLERNAPQSKLDKLGVTTWTKWGCQPSKFEWTFETTETIYLLDGKANIYVDGHEGSFELGRGDLAVFPKGTKITVHALEVLNKHYSRQVCDI